MDNKSKITFRKATKDDTDFALAVHHKAFRDVIVRQFGPWEDEVQDKFFFNDWSNTGFEIIYFEGKPCGYMRIEYLPGGIKAHELVLSPDFHNLGIGSYVLKQLQVEATRRKLPVNLNVLHENRAIELYKRLGFKEIGQNDMHKFMEWSLPN